MLFSGRDIVVQKIMANRHLARSVVLQSLFEMDFRKYDNKEMINVIKRDSDEFASGFSGDKFMVSLADNILKKQSELDDIISKAAPEWPVDKISIVDRNALRIGLYELLYSDRKEVPAKVAINEAIELAKTFGGENSGMFVNGVLGAVYKELGEPGKDAVSARKGTKKEADPKTYPLEQLGGAVVYAKDGDEIYLAFVHDIFGHWTLSKGRIEQGENEEEATIREIKEELGLDLKIEMKLGENEYIASDPETGKKRKRVTYYLGSSPYSKLTLEKKGGLDGAEWFKIAEIANLNFYNDILPIITKAVTLIRDGSKKDITS